MDAHGVCSQYKRGRGDRQAVYRFPQAHIAPGLPGKRFALDQEPGIRGSNRMWRHVENMPPHSITASGVRPESPSPPEYRGEGTHEIVTKRRNCQLAAPIRDSLAGGAGWSKIRPANPIIFRSLQT